MSTLADVDPHLVIELGIFCVAALAAVFCLVGCFYVVPYQSCCPSALCCSFCVWKAGMQEFNSLWAARVVMLLSSAVLMVAHMLPLASIWSPNSLLPTWSMLEIDTTDVQTMCRAFLVVALGFAEPFLLLVALFACRASYRKSIRDRSTSHSAHILLLAAISTLPILLSQSLFAFINLLPNMGYVEGNDLQDMFLSVSKLHTRNAVCRPSEPNAANIRPECTACLYPASSTILSGIFFFIYLLALWSTFDNVARAALNYALRRRLRALQGILTVALLVGVALRGVGLVASPDELSFALIRLGYFLSVLTYMQAICWQLIWWPILDTRRAEWKAECYWQMHEEGSAGSPVRMRHAFSLEGGEITSSETRVQSPFS